MVYAATNTPKMCVFIMQLCVYMPHNVNTGGEINITQNVPVNFFVVVAELDLKPMTK